MPSYNHRDYVGEAIKTVLAQDFQDFEFLIADDCSKDDSVEVIKKYEDPRIKHFFLKQNVGPTQILKMLIENAQGEYIALINSDDLWHKDKLSKQIQVLENDKNLAACFTWADFVDENGKIISENSNENVNIFIEKNKTRSQWLNWFFHNGNCLCHPSVLIRKSVYSDIGFYNDMYRQLPDFEYWVRLTLKYSFYIIEEVLTDHRRTTGENTNTSANTRVNNLRLMNEGVSIAKKMLMEADENLHIEAFKDEFVISGAKSKEELVLERLLISNVQSVKVTYAVVSVPAEPPV
jgi:glycosyltransferase involved in cell wall biosynthesis